MIIDELIDTRELDRVSAIVSTASGLRKALKRTESAKRLYRVLALGEIPIERVEVIVHELTQHFQHGVHFRYEPELCLLAVVLEEHDSEIAAKFLSDLAEVQIAEMPMSSKVAAICLENRKRHPKNQRKHYVASVPTWYTFEELRLSPTPSVPTLIKHRFERSIGHATEA